MNEMYETHNVKDIYKRETRQTIFVLSLRALIQSIQTWVIEEHIIVTVSFLHNLFSIIKVSNKYNPIFSYYG